MIALYGMGYSITIVNAMYLEKDNDILTFFKYHFKGLIILKNNCIFKQKNYNW